MIVDGYKAFVNKSDVASVVKEYVAIIAVGISGVGNGKLCSQLNTAISFDEAMYLFEGMWLFLFAKDRFFIQPSAFESEIHPSHNTSFCTLCISPLQGAITPETAVGSYTDAYASTHIMQ